LGGNDGLQEIEDRRRWSEGKGHGAGRRGYYAERHGGGQRADIRRQKLGRQEGQKVRKSEDPSSLFELGAWGFALRATTPQDAAASRGQKTEDSGARSWEVQEVRRSEDFDCDGVQKLTNEFES